METVIKKMVTNLNPKSVSILTQEFEVELVTEKRIEMQTKTETQTRIEMQTQTKTEIQIVDGEEVEVEIEVEVPVEVEFEAEVEVPVEVEVEVERETQIGSNHRCAYTNSESGRVLLSENEPENIVEEVMEVWGDAPTVEEVKFDESYTPEPTTEERIAELETQLLESAETSILLYEGQLAQEEINSAQDVAIIEIYEMLS